MQVLGTPRPSCCEAAVPLYHKNIYSLIWYFDNGGGECCLIYCRLCNKSFMHYSSTIISLSVQLFVDCSCQQSDHLPH